MRPTPYVASLRIYEPLSAFKPEVQIRLDAIPLSARTGQEEQDRALLRTIVMDEKTDRPDGAHLIEFEGKKFAAPWSTSTRVWVALDRFKVSVPQSIVRYFIPEEVEENILANAENIGDEIPHILTETWMVPPRWFGLFTPEERLRGITDDGPFVVHRTNIENAKLRCMHMHKVVVQAFGNGPIEGEIADLLEWMDMFDSESIVELDYGGLAIYMDHMLRDVGGLSEDTSQEDLLFSLAGLANGDGVMAGQGYERLMGRWRRLSGYENAS